MIKRIFFRIVLIAIPILSIFGLDIAAGYFKETAGIRESRRLFLEEVSQLSIRTLNMVPLLDHGYRPIGDYESLEPGSENSIRYMRTSKSGLILPTEPTSSAISNGKPLRILFLGGSTTECNEVHEPFRFPAVVGSLLSKSGIQVNISNAGVRGHTTQDSINALLNRPGFREHDIVFLMHNINDRLRLAIQNGYQAQLGEFGQGSGESVKASSIGLIMSLWDWGSLRSNMLYLARPFVQNIISVIENKSEIAIDERVINFRHENHKSHLEIFRVNLGVFVSSVKALGKTPVLMTQALGVHSSEQDDYNNVIREVARTEHVRIVDLAKLLGEEASWAFLSDGIHLNNEGSAVIGYLIAKQLATDLKISGKIDNQYLRLMPTLPQDLLSRCAPPNNSIGRAGEPRLLLSRPGRYPSFSPDGKIIIFHSYDKEYREYMMAFHLESKSYINLSEGNLKNERHPAFLRYQDKGFSVVFGSSDANGELESLKIRIWPGNKTVDLATGKLLGSIPAVKGDDIYFAGYEPSGPKSVPNIYKYNLSLGSTEQITNSTAENWRPAVGSDGAIYFIGSTLENGFDIYRIDDSSKSPELAFTSKEDEWDPAISPDAQLIAFASKLGGKWNIYLGKSDSLQKANRITDLPGNSWDPSFDPTGRMIVFASTRNHQPYIYGLCVFGEKSDSDH